jgi:signal transduction histidine kinase
MSERPLAEVLRLFPGAVLALAPDGTVLDSNGRLEERVRRAVVGRPLAELLEKGSREKVGPALLAASQARRIELAFDEGTTYRLRTFVMVRAAEAALLLEQPPELSEAPVYEEISALNAELNEAHRELSRERGRLKTAFAAEAEARALAESSRRTVEILDAIGELALRQSEPEALLRDVLQRLCEGLRVDFAVVLLLEEDGRSLAVRAAQGLPPLAWPQSVAVGEGLAGRVAAARQVVVSEDLGHTPYVNDLARANLGSLLGAPMVAENRLLGVLEVGTLAPRRYAAEEISAVKAAAERLASAVERQRLWAAERAARAAAQDAVRQRDEVLAIVAHDLRNPLNRMLMSASILKEEFPAGAAPRMFTIMERAVKGMDRLVRDLLDVSRLEAGAFRVELAPVAVPALLAEVAEEFAELGAARGVRLERAVAEDVPPAHADRARLLQALSNLLDNAVRVTPSGGTVTVSAARANDAVELSVRDAGPGIPAEQLPHLFDRFWQGPRERRGGAGLGLAIVKGIVDAHGGRLAVESRVGEGTSFRIWIPAER